MLNQRESGKPGAKTGHVATEARQGMSPEGEGFAVAGRGIGSGEEVPWSMLPGKRYAGHDNAPMRRSKVAISLREMSEKRAKADHGDD